jgi:hypothetical protein
LRDLGTFRGTLRLSGQGAFFEQPHSYQEKIVFRKALISFAATLAFGFGIAGMTLGAEAKNRGSYNRFESLADHHIYKEFSDGYYGYQDCRYRRVAIKKWNKAHTKLIKVYKNRWVCY